MPKKKGDKLIVGQPVIGDKGNPFFNFVQDVKSQKSEKAKEKMVRRKYLPYMTVVHLQPDGEGEAERLPVIYPGMRFICGLCSKIIAFASLANHVSSGTAQCPGLQVKHKKEKKGKKGKKGENKGYERFQKYILPYLDCKKEDEMDVVHDLVEKNPGTPHKCTVFTPFLFFLTVT